MTLQFVLNLASIVSSSFALGIITMADIRGNVKLLLQVGNMVLLFSALFILAKSSGAL
jgi:hypothetical protein